jgi:parallel beta-helix repeat protein
LDLANILWRPFGDVGLGFKRRFVHGEGAFLARCVNRLEIQTIVTVAAAGLLSGCGSTHISPNQALYWATPDAVSYGIALTALQLDATASVPGSFTYTPTAGTLLSVGSHALSVTFSPADPSKYAAASATVTLTVNKATPAIIWNQPTAISYGTPLSGAQLNATARTVDGTFTYSPDPGTVLIAGSQTLSATFNPSDGMDYQSASATVTMTVNRVTPVVYWPKPGPIVYGTVLSNMQLDAISNGIAGTFTYSPPAGTIPGVGSQALTAAFVPVDAKDYGPVTASQTLAVIDATPPVITSQPQDQAVGLGQPATLSVAATGQGPLTYQWLKNSVYIQNATSPTYTTPPTMAADNGGSFSVVVADSVQHTTSTSAKLTVSVPLQSSYYVATDGSDQADGSESTPFATLHRAQLAMQSSATKVARIKSGTYYLTSALVLTEADQGETWGAVPGATVILSGGQVITGWTSEGNGVFSAQTVQPVGLDLTIEGNRQMPADRAYDPNQPYTSGWNVIAPTLTQGYNSTFAVLPADLTASVKPGALVQVIDHCRWNDVFTRIVSVDAAAKTVTVTNAFDAGSSSGLAGSWRVLLAPEDLTTIGQFAYEPESSRIYIMPVSAESLGSSTVVAAQLGTLISIRNVDGITISGLTFSDTTSDTIEPSGSWDDSNAAIMADNVNASTISGNTFLNVGKGIVLRGSSNSTIVGNSFEHLGLSGINLFSNCNHNTIANNSLKDIGQTNLLSFGVSINDSSFNLVDSNLIDGVGRWGIVFGPSGEASDLAFRNTGNVLSNNVIRNTSNRTNDSGAIYGGASTIAGYLKEDLLISGNRIENVGGLVREASGHYAAGFTQGIYMDDHLSGVTITNNVIESGSTYGVVMCHGCSHNSASNNVVILQPAPVYDRNQYGSTFSTGGMTYNGTTRIDLLPSYFPDDVKTSTIVVQLAGRAYAGTSATFDLQVDGSVVGSGTASDRADDYVFKVALKPHRVHRVGIALTNGADSGTTTRVLNNLSLIVNNTAVGLAAPEAQGNDGSFGFAAIPDDQMVSDFSVTQNIIYRNGGLSQDVFDMTPTEYPFYEDPEPGTIDSNLLFQNVSAASDQIFGGQQLDLDTLVADPLFANPSSGDYRLQTGSPALAIGFKTSGVPLLP